jgi:hypothetical protein
MNAVLGLGVAVWVAQEWFIHAKLFHGNIEWFGKRIHEDHHKETYHHISIDGADLALPVIGLACAVFMTIFGSVLGSTGAFAYVFMGLVCYQKLNVFLDQRGMC